MHLNVNHAIFNSNLQKGISKFSSHWFDNRLRNMPFIINMQLINQNIKSSSNLEFEIKSQTLNMFQLNKKWENFVIKNNCCDQLLWF